MNKTHQSKLLRCLFLVLSKLDFGSFFLSGCQQYFIDKLSKVQNSSVSFVLQTRKSENTTLLTKLSSGFHLKQELSVSSELSPLLSARVTYWILFYFSNLLSVHTLLEASSPRLTVTIYPFHVQRQSQMDNMDMCVFLLCF